MSPRSFACGLFAMGVLLGSTADAGPLTPREIYRNFGKGVVLVFATDGSAAGSAGTGSVITKDGQIITNAHVVAKGAEPYKKLFVYLKPDKLKGSMKDDLQQRFKATLVDIDPQLDLALLQLVDAPADLVAIDFADPEDVEIGEPVVAIGHPETGGLWTLTTGSISSVVADFNGIEGKHVFQTEASVNRGNSGGPLLNAYGQMVGINTCISRRAEDGLAITDINFSLKSSVAVEWLKRRKLLELAYAKPGEAAAVVAAVEAPAAKPSKDEVAEDPGFVAAATADQTVSRGVAGKPEVKKPQPGKPAVSEEDERLKAKTLTKKRPYQMDQFVSARVKEIRAMEDMMKDMSDTIQKKTGNKTKKPGNGMGLW